MDLRFISTLTPEDEDRYAPMILAPIKALLDLTPISNSVRITTANSSIFQHMKAEADMAGPESAKSLACAPSRFGPS